MTRTLLFALPLLALAACQDAPADAAGAEAAGAETSAAPPAAASEGDDHGHDAPHGGTVKTAGGGHLELVVDGRELKVYPLDGEEAGLPVTAIAGAQTIVQPQSGSAQTVALAPMGDHLMGTVPAGVTAYTAIVTVPVAGETRSARFEVGLDGDTDHAH